MKRTSREIRKDILKTLSNGKEYSYGEIERKVDTNWQTVRNHCEEFKILGFVAISKENRIKITKEGIEFLKKL